MSALRRSARGAVGGRQLLRERHVSRARLLRTARHQDHQLQADRPSLLVRAGERRPGRDHVRGPRLRRDLHRRRRAVRCRHAAGPCRRRALVWLRGRRAGRPRRCCRHRSHHADARRFGHRQASDQRHQPRPRCGVLQRRRLHAQHGGQRVLRDLRLASDDHRRHRAQPRRSDRGLWSAGARHPLGRRARDLQRHRQRRHPPCRARRRDGRCQPVPWSWPRTTTRRQRPRTPAAASPGPSRARTSRARRSPPLPRSPASARCSCASPTPPATRPSRRRSRSPRAVPSTARAAATGRAWWRGSPATRSADAARRARRSASCVRARPWGGGTAPRSRGSCATPRASRSQAPSCGSLCASCGSARATSIGARSPPELTAASRSASRAVRPAATASPIARIRAMPASPRSPTCPSTRRRASPSTSRATFAREGARASAAVSPADRCPRAA